MSRLKVWFKRKQVAIAFVLMFFSVLIGLLMPVIRMKIKEYRVISKISPMLEKRANYIPGPFWGLTGSGDNGTSPPYILTHIFSQDCEDFKFVHFTFDDELDLISEEIKPRIERKPAFNEENVDPLYHGAILELQLSNVEQIINGKDELGILGDFDEYDALLMINQLISENPGNKRADSLKQILDNRIPVTGCGGDESIND